jgi:hypothetical protein
MPEQVEFRPAEPMSLEGFQPIDLTFDLVQLATRLGPFRNYVQDSGLPAVTGVMREVRKLGSHF